MELAQRSKRERFGLPEFIGILLFIPALAGVGLWLTTVSTKSWDSTTGQVLQSEVRNVHYNAQDSPARVDLTYQYSVDNRTYTSNWTGYWPSTGSPNALMPDQLDLLQQDFSLAIFYNRDSPSTSRLHDVPAIGRRAYAGLAIGGFLAALVYCVQFYPAWRYRMTLRFVRA